MEFSINKTRDNARRFINRVLLVAVRSLRFTLPSRRDSARVFLARSGAFVGVGVAIWILISSVMPGSFLFPRNWVLSLRALANWFQILVYIVLTAVMVWSLCYAVGMLFLLSLRGIFRIWLGRRIAAQSQKGLAEKAGLLVG